MWVRGAVIGTIECGFDRRAGPVAWLLVGAPRFSVARSDGLCLVLSRGVTLRLGGPGEAAEIRKKRRCSTAELSASLREDVLPRKAGGQRNPDLANGDADVCADFQQLQSNGMGLCAREFGAGQSEPPNTFTNNSSTAVVSHWIFL